MFLYRCSNCGKEVVPKAFRELSIKAYGIDIHKRSTRFCQCENPDIEKSKREYEKSIETIADVIREVSLEHKPNKSDFKHSSNVTFKVIK